MGILKDQLTGTKFNYGGAQPAQWPGADKNSTLHFQSSINNNPKIKAKPSELDLDGKTPAGYKHPETGATFG